jgi:hypothetical protein
VNCSKEANLAAEPFGHEAVVNPGPIANIPNAKFVRGCGEEHFLGGFKEEVHSFLSSSSDSFHYFF